MKKIVLFFVVLWTGLVLAVVAKADEPKQCNCPLVAVVREPIEILVEKLGYCKVPAPNGHGVYYVMINGKCVAKVK